MFAQVVFIVWRESLEALLVVGILHAWLAHQGAGPGALRPLWGGVAAGVGLAVALSVVLLRFGEALPPEGQEYFQIGLTLVAAVLIVQMVFWMRAQGGGLRRGLEQGLSAAVQSGSRWGVFAIAMIAVAREGAETVVFLYGVTAGGGGGEVAAGIALALMLAAASYALLQIGGRVLSWRLFFRVTEVMLLLLAAALFVRGVETLAGLGFLPYGAALWDSSALLDDGGRVGGIIADLTGYRAAPDLVTLGAWVVYWGGIAAGFAALARRKRLRLGGARP